jgi:hypothetical protein
VIGGLLYARLDFVVCMTVCCSSFASFVLLNFRRNSGSDREPNSDAWLPTCQHADSPLFERLSMQQWHSDAFCISHGPFPAGIDQARPSTEPRHRCGSRSPILCHPESTATLGPLFLRSREAWLRAAVQAVGSVCQQVLIDPR